MLLSMTGYGEARHQSDSLQLAVELRALNNRYLKVSVRSPEPYNLLEPEIERVLRRVIKRGTIHVQIHARRQSRAQDFQLNSVALQAYRDQLRALQQQAGGNGDVPLAGLLALPGVIVEPDFGAADPGAEWQVLELVLEAALKKLQDMRAEEGRAMAKELLSLRDHIGRELDAVKVRAPRVVADFRDKLLERIKSLLGELDVQIDRSDLIKEVAIFAERSDITEEIVRLGSHLVQFQEITKEPESPGRKLDFLTQEMFREANTIGSKANDVEIAKHVVEIKGAIEKIRELIQNIE